MQHFSKAQTYGLIGVVARFQQKSIAFMEDIEEIFYQVNLPEVDSDLCAHLDLAVQTLPCNSV